MSLFVLYLTSGKQLKIVKWTDPPPLIDEPILGRRDPDIPIEWKSGSYYLDPISYPKGLFIYQGDEKLVNVFSSTEVKSKLKHGRTWFELLPQKISFYELNSKLQTMIRAIPTNTEQIAKGFLHYHSLRIPTDLKMESDADWIEFANKLEAWVGPTLKFSLENYSNCIISGEDHALFYKNEVLKVGLSTRMRAYQIRTVTKVVRQLIESNTFDFEVPIEILNAGYEAVKAWAFLDPDRAAKLNFTIEVTEEVLETHVDKSTQMELALWTRPAGGNWTTIRPEHQQTVFTLVQEILESN